MLILHYIFIKRQLRPDVGRSILKLIDDNQNANLALFQFDQCCKRCESLILNRLFDRELPKNIVFLESYYAHKKYYPSTVISYANPNFVLRFMLSSSTSSL